MQPAMREKASVMFLKTACYKHATSMPLTHTATNKYKATNMIIVSMLLNFLHQCSHSVSVFHMCVCTRAVQSIMEYACTV